MGEIVLADPPLNLFGLELARSLVEAVTQARDSDARAILVRAEGDNFSAGANVEMFLDRDEAAARELIDEFIPVIRRFAEIPVPTVAAVQGLCLAAGLEVALSCDLIWAAEGSNLGLVEAVIGATPFGGGTQRLVARAGAGRAAEAVLTARAYPAETMLDWGVVNRVVPSADLLEKARAFAQRLAAGPTVAHASHEADDPDHRRRGGGGCRCGAARRKERRVMASEDLQNGARTLLEKGPGQATFAGR